MLELLLTLMFLQVDPEPPDPPPTETFYVGTNLQHDPYPKMNTSDMLVLIARVTSSTTQQPHTDWQIAGATIPAHQRPIINGGLEVEAAQSELLTVEFMARVLNLGNITTSTETEASNTACDVCLWTQDSNTVTIEFQVCEFTTRGELLDCMNVTDPSGSN